MRLTKLTVRGFRGFCDEQPIVLDSNVILVYGLNGSGKSSFTEALEWLFFGEISRQRLSRCPSEYREEYLKNLFYTGTENPYVEVEGTIDSAKRTIRKELDGGGIKYFIDGNVVDNFSNLSLNLENYFRPMLAQTEIKALVDTEQKDRWEQLSSILGQDELSKLREFLINLKNSKRDKTYKQVEAKWQAIVGEVEENQTLNSLVNPVKDRNITDLGRALQKLIGLKTIDLAAILEKIISQEKVLMNSELGGRIANIAFGDAGGFSTYLAEPKQQLSDMEKHCVDATKEGHDHEYLDFLEVGKGYVKGDICPFCLARTVTKERLDHIGGDLAKRKAAKTAIDNFIKTNDKIDAWKAGISTSLSAFHASETELKVIFQKLTSIEEEKLASEVQQFLKQAEDEIKRSRKALEESIDLYTGFLEKTYFHKENPDAQTRDKYDEAVKQAVASRTELITKWETIKQSLSEKMPVSGNTDQAEIRKWLLMEKVARFFSNSGLFLRQYDALQKIDFIQLKLETFEKAEVTVF
jgi:DNA repair exonuclease SbcCD ATPase subunit